MGQQEFDLALEKVKTLPAQGPDVLLNLYGYFKQATIGDVEGKRPGALDFKGRAKYDAWASKKGMTQEEAMQAYVDYVEKLVANQ